MHLFKDLLRELISIYIAFIPRTLSLLIFLTRAKNLPRNCRVCTNRSIERAADPFLYITKSCDLEGSQPRWPLREFYKPGARIMAKKIRWKFAKESDLIATHFSRSRPLFHDGCWIAWIFSPLSTSSRLSPVYFSQVTPFFTSGSGGEKIKEA